jgi:uncharacterized protein (TIGR02217 family)
MSNAFDSVRLPEQIEKGSQGGPKWQTTVVSLSTGFEQRNQDWPSQRCEYDISYGIDTKTEWYDVIKFFYARKGRARGFRFKDWSDFESDGAQVLGTGNGVLTTFQLKKKYTSVVDYERTITRPVSGTVLVYLNGVLQTLTTHYTINHETGIITFVTPPPSSPVTTVTAEFEFDVPVRFDTDKLTLDMQTADAMAVSSIPIVELRE